MKPYFDNVKLLKQCCLYLVAACVAGCAGQRVKKGVGDEVQNHTIFFSDFKGLWEIDIVRAEHIPNLQFDWDFLYISIDGSILVAGDEQVFVLDSKYMSIMDHYDDPLSALHLRWIGQDGDIHLYLSMVGQEQKSLHVTVASGVTLIASFECERANSRIPGKLKASPPSIDSLAPYMVPSKK